MKYNIAKDEFEYINNIWKKIEEKIEIQCKRIGSIMPYIPINGKYEDMGDKNLHWWTNGFWAGILWQMYNATKNELYKNTANEIEIKLDKALEQFTKLDHDVGFMWLHTSVANYRLTNNTMSRTRGLHASGILSGRFNINGEYIRAWNADNEGIFIVDCLMNLPLLYWAEEETKDYNYRVIAKKHADTTLKYIIREDGSCNHLVKLDEKTGEFIDNPGGQGYERGSSWSRGQAWAIYGMALSYRYTKDEKYLDASKKVAHYFCSQVALTDYMPLLDFRAPKEPVYYDTTAGMCAVCGLLELSEYVTENEKYFYINFAFKILKSITDKCANWDLDMDSIIDKGSGRYHRESDREVPIIYGDYFFIEAVLRFLDKGFMIW